MAELSIGSKTSPEDLNRQFREYSSQLSTLLSSDLTIARETIDTGLLRSVKIPSRVKGSTTYFWPVYYSRKKWRN